MSRLPFVRTLRGKLTLALAAATLLVLPPVVAASLHIHQMNEVNRALTQVEQLHARAEDAAARRRHERQIRRLREQFSLVSDRAYRDVLTLTALSLLVLGVVTTVLPRRVLRPLRRLTALLGQAEGGRLDVARAEVTPDEVGALAHRMNLVFSQLGQLDQLRREKISDLAAQRDLLLELCPAPAVLLDPEGRVIRASSRFGETFGRDAAALADRNLVTAMGWEQSELAGALARGGDASALEIEGGTYEVELWTLRPRGDGKASSLLLLHAR